MIEWNGPLGYFRGDAEDVAYAAHVLKHALEPHVHDEDADESAREPRAGRVVPFRATADTPVARVLVDDRKLDIPVPPDGMTAQTLGTLAASATGWQSDSGAAVVVDAGTDAIVPMAAPVQPGGVYRLRSAR